jgi:hypothetical protein
MINPLVLAMRASPDWAALADLHAAGHPVKPSQYLPPMHAGFPIDIVPMIERWNKNSKVSYFACRQRMREIAALNIASVGSVLSVRCEQVADLLQQVDDQQLLLFYHDDDDWFHPDMASLLEPLGATLSTVDAAVFPFFRLASNMVTFTHGGRPTRCAVGRIEPFRYRYCTNNYGLTARALTGKSSKLIQHIDASNHANAMRFEDAHCDLIISATSKTPCSASWLSKLPDQRDLFVKYIEAYIASMENIKLGHDNAWLAAPVRSTVELFASTID